MADGLSHKQTMEYIRELNTSAHNLYRIADSWLKSLPTRDAAEGAGGSIAMTCCATDEQIAAYLADQKAATPKPAPDAVREALDPYGFEKAMLEACARYAQQLCEQQGRNEQWYVAVRQVPDKIRALSAPVPPPERVGEQ